MITPHEPAPGGSQNARKDTRFVYSSRCCFWGPIQAVATTGQFSLPCCPHCKAPLFEMESREVWEQRARDYARKQNDPRYLDFLNWVEKMTAAKGCIILTTQAHFNELRALFEKENPKP